MPTIFKPIEGFPGYYVASNGAIWSKWKTRGNPYGGRGVVPYISDKARKLKPKVDSKGYCRITLQKDGKPHDFLIHRLILMAFRGPPPEGTEGCHKDGNKGNNGFHNLYWGTRQQNVQDSIRHGIFYNATEAAAIANKGKKRSEETKAKISITQKGKKKTPKQIANMKANHWSKRADAKEIAAKSANKNRGKKHTKEHKKKISEGNRRRWARYRGEEANREVD
jgi:hypothetical protein